VRGQSPRKTTDAGGDKSPAPDFCALILDGIDAPILVPKDPNLIADLRHCIQGWPLRLVPFDPDTAPTNSPITVIEPRGPGRFRAFSRYLDKGLDDLPAATAVCAALADLSQAYCETGDGLAFGLHCGAVSINRHGVILAGERRAGKSTLVARLSPEAAVQVLCDDVLPVDNAGMGIGLGLAPRLRLPLPDTATPCFRAHVARWLGPADDRYGYLVPPTLAAHGQRIRLDAFIHLDRRPDAAAALHILPADELLQSLINRSITGPDGTEAVFEAAKGLASRLTGLRLVYWDLEEAVALLRSAFPSDDSKLDDAVHILPPLPSDRLSSGLPLPARAMVSASIRFRRMPGTATRRVGEAAFLWRPEDAMLWHLNPTAQAIWQLLAKPATARSLSRDLGHVFQDVPAQLLLDDTRKLLAQLECAGFVAAATKA
jgi:hypothetical protein